MGLMFFYFTDCNKKHKFTADYLEIDNFRFCRICVKISENLRHLSINKIPEFKQHSTFNISLLAFKHLRLSGICAADIISGGDILVVRAGISLITFIFLGFRQLKIDVGFVFGLKFKCFTGRGDGIVPF
ncbi:MAG: hypothetical protein MZV64_50355 [Ignavibacteriales bacterium]|nr:hypothetical protein [Ignavibacteriales bacterium]